MAEWYVISTRTGYENVVATNLKTIVENQGLQHWIQDVRIPTETVEEIKNGQRKEVERMILPSYVLVKMEMNDESWYVVRNVRGCTGFVGPNRRPTPLTEKEIISLGLEEILAEEAAAVDLAIAMMDAGAAAARKIVVNYAVGDTVRLISGPMENFSGTVKRIDLEKNEVQVSIFWMGQETPVELELDQVERVE